MSMGDAPGDTAPDVLEAHVRLVARMTPAERVRRMRDLTLAANRLALVGVRKRYPAADDTELFLRLAALRLGDDVVERVYGWRAPPDGA
jgi:hypothetical protein